MKEMTLPETALLRWIEETAAGGDLEDKGLHVFLQNFYTLSCLWRTPLEVILTNGKSDSLTTEEYQNYLDDRASGIKLDWDGE